MKRSVITIFLLAIFTLLVGVLRNEESVDRILYFDVGQGDASLIEVDGKRVLIDGGPGDAILYQLDNYLDDRDFRIEVLVLSHFHSDHYSGFRDLIERYEVEKVYLPMYCDQDVLSAFSEIKNVEMIEVGVNSYKEISIGNGTLLMGVLGGKDSLCVKGEDINNGSIVSELEYDDELYLFMGDVEREGEQKLPSSDFKSKDYNTLVLKAGHHCSSTSSTRSFLSLVRPMMVICSVGEGNPYDHPSDEVLERFEDMGIEYEVTSESGDIVVLLK